MSPRRRKPTSHKRSKKKYPTNFKEAVGKDVERREKKKQGFGYLQLPKGIDMWKAEPKSKAYLDIIPYEVTDENHPDAIPDEGIAVPGTLWYKRPFHIHRNIGADNDSVVCLKTISKSCPI